MAPLEIRHRSVRPISAKHAQASRFLQQSLKYDEESQKFLYAEYIDIYYWGIDEPKTFYLSETNFKNGFFAITLNVWGIDVDFTVPVGE
ncbi:TPA: hypothetical protein KH825_004768 [Escherichia coli]|nr:hypothetical protein [Escherichia coli]